jgi:ribonuclease-3
MPASIQGLNQRRLKDLDQLCARLGVTFGRMGLLHEALTHSSYAAEAPGTKDYERLEFFGDAILKFVLSEYLLERFPEHQEGELTQIRAVLVSDKTLAELANEINLSKYILLGHNVQMRPSIMAQAMEAVIAAVYIDLGLIHVQNLVVRSFGKQATEIERDEIKDNYKAELQTIVQAQTHKQPVYELTKMDGPPHDPTFEVAVIISGKPVASGSGRTKKAAEQEAARQALISLGNRHIKTKGDRPEPEPTGQPD